MKNKVILIVLIIIGVTVAGGTFYLLRQGEQENGDGDSAISESGLDEYEDLNTFISGLIAEAEESETMQPEDVLSIELFELDPENEELGDVY